MLRSIARLSKTAARPMARAMPKVVIPARSMADNPYYNVKYVPRLSVPLSLLPTPPGH